ncbi:MAG TPA: NAD(P)/FAD-dependent oxidoreductase [Solirubrobacteraceae bacterium]|nr:NAD(P)/FAD-dependent oxidoreductase [Solirubrobacteraceae bacterium]
MSTSSGRSASYDAILIGSGHNALVCGTYLARAGWSTLVVERGERLGGAVASAELTRPGYIHDLFATNMNLFLGSPVNAELGGELERHGLSYASSDRPFANVYPGGKALRVRQDVGKTLAELEAHDPADAAGWRELDALYARLSPALFSLYGSRLDTRSLARLAVAQVPGLGTDGCRELARLLVSSTRELAETYLHSPEAHALLACWGMHLDFGPDVSGGAMFPFLEAFTDMRTGISIVQGGASKLIEALAGLGAEAGMELRTGAEVTRVSVAGGRAVGVELASGERIAARRAVIAGVTPPILSDLLDDGSLPHAVRIAARRYTFGPGTLMVHLALSRSPEWAAGEELSRFAYVHIAPFVHDLANTYAQACAGLLPAEPMLVVGQTSAVDPARVPAGEDGAVLWVQVRALPASIRGDAGGTIEARDWSAAAEPYADRVLAKLERYAPGIGELVLDRAVLTPADLERHDPNLAGGDSIAGSMHLRQNFLFRPSPGVADYETGIGGLLMVGAATWPGAGVNALSGYNVAHKLLAPARSRGDDLRLALSAARAAGGPLVRAASRRR